jgi:hypothetical protein
VLEADLVRVEYAKAMRQAQLFEAALQVVAIHELELPDGELSPEELQERTERFFSRGIGWIQQRLDLTGELANEIDALRKARNELAHEYLLRPCLREARSGREREKLSEEPCPEHMQQDLRSVEEEHMAEARAAVAELRSLQTRFELCSAQLSSRWFPLIGRQDRWWAG